MVTRVNDREDWGFVSTCGTRRLFTSSPLSPTKAPLRSSLQQNVRPTISHPATQPHLLGTNALRCASVDTHGSNALHCCTSSICSTCPTILGAHATNFESRITFFGAGSRRWPTYLQYWSHAHTALLLSTALPTTTSPSHSQSLVVPGHAALSTPPLLF